MKPETAWKWMPAAILGATFIFGVWRVMVAVDDPHFAAVENAYEKGGNWDMHRAEVRASEALGWKISLTPGAAQAEGSVQSTLLIHSPDGAALGGVSGEVVAFHNGYPQQLYSAEIVASAPGQYSFEMPLHLAGYWRWQLRLQRGDDLWVGELRETVASGVVQ